MNKVIMTGRITHDLELKVTPNGTNVCQFRIAVNRRYQKKGEERKVDFFNVVAWRYSAEFVTKYFSKGNLIMVEGELQTRPYTDKNGNPSIWTEIVADHLEFTGEKTNKSTDNAPPLPEVPPQYGDSTENDVPFGDPPPVDAYPF